MNTTVFMNQSGSIYQIYSSAVTNITGSEFVALLGLIIMIIAFFMLFNLPTEITAFIILPMLIIFGVYSQDLVGFLGLTIFYIGFLFAKNFFISS
jgi:hypothetical protein